MCFLSLKYRLVALLPAVVFRIRKAMLKKIVWLVRELIEKELKAIIDEGTYLRLFENFKWDEQITQINHYYSDELSIIGDKGISLRIRSINDEYMLQVKFPIAAKGALSAKNEYEEITKEVPSVISSESLRYILDFDVGDAYLIGELKTERSILDCGNGVLLCLDKNFYLGCVDYEIEIEFSSKIEESLLASLAREGVDFESCAVGKYSRFLKSHEANKEI
jgi:uncharacterized protein YjbK